MSFLCLTTKDVRGGGVTSFLWWVSQSLDKVITGWRSYHKHLKHLVIHRPWLLHSKKLPLWFKTHPPHFKLLTVEKEAAFDLDLLHLPVLQRSKDPLSYTELFISLEHETWSWIRSCLFQPWQDFQISGSLPQAHSYSPQCCLLVGDGHQQAGQRCLRQGGIQQHHRTQVTSFRLYFSPPVFPLFVSCGLTICDHVGTWSAQMPSPSATLLLRFSFLSLGASTATGFSSSWTRSWNLTAFLCSTCYWFVLGAPWCVTGVCLPDGDIGISCDGGDVFGISGGHGSLMEWRVQLLRQVLQQGQGVVVLALCGVRVLRGSVTAFSLRGLQQVWGTSSFFQRRGRPGGIVSKCAVLHVFVLCWWCLTSDCSSRTSIFHPVLISLKSPTHSELSFIYMHGGMMSIFSSRIDWSRSKETKS